MIWKEKVYDALYKKADDFFQANELCKWKDGRCRGMRSGNEYLKKGCCCFYGNSKDGSGCKNLGSSGCQIESLGCKLWYCEVIEKENPWVRGVLVGLRVAAEEILGRKSCYVYWSKEDWLKSLEEKGGRMKYLCKKCGKRVPLRY